MDPKILLLVVLMCAIVLSSYLAGRASRADETPIRARNHGGTGANHGGTGASS